jgi:hypothetical protein
MAKTSTFQTNEDGDYVAGDLKGYCEGEPGAALKRMNLSLKVHLLNDLAELLFQLWLMSWFTGGSPL